MSQTNILLESGTNELELVEFFLNETDGYSGYYGVNVAKVVEITRMQPITVMPQMRHSSVMGAFKYRDGRIVPLIDLAKYLDKERAESFEPKIIVTEFNNVITAFLVSGVTRIHRMSWQDVESPGSFIQSMSESITGVVRLEDRTVFVLDMEKIVGDMGQGLSVCLEHPEVFHTAGRRYRIFHADDSSSVRNLVKSMLEKSGAFEVIQATNGGDAWDYLLSVRKKIEADGTPLSNYIDGVISDIEMPRMDGLTLCKQIKEDPILKELPVALFSSLVTDALIHKGLSVGADAQFAKPDLMEITAKMISLMEVHDSKQA